MSILEEPPQERRPIQTYVMENNPEFIREAIHRELSRGGQVFYLYNRVETIGEEAFRVQNLAPEAQCCLCPWADVRKRTGKYHAGLHQR